jgi:hypothetical protein
VSLNTVRVRFYFAGLSIKDTDTPLGSYKEIDILVSGEDVLPRMLQEASRVVIIKEIALEVTRVPETAHSAEVIYDGTTLYVSATSYDIAYKGFQRVLYLMTAPRPPFPGGVPATD